jgi:hypothetical protein
MIVVPELAPTEEQFARIGRIHVTWAAVERGVQSIISRLAVAPDWPTGALTDNLIFEQRLRSIDTLLEIHRRQLAFHVISENLCNEIAELRKGLAKHREMRNRLAHWVIFRSGSDIAAARFATRTASPDREDFKVYKNSDLDDHVLAITALSAQVMTILDTLPKQQDPFERISPRK